MTGLNGRRPTSGRRAPNVIWPQIARSARPGTSQREDFQHARVASPPLLLNRAYRKPAAGRSQHAIARGTRTVRADRKHKRVDTPARAMSRKRRPRSASPGPSDRRQRSRQGAAVHPRFARVGSGSGLSPEPASDQSTQIQVTCFPEAEQSSLEAKGPTSRDLQYQR